MIPCPSFSETKAIRGTDVSISQLSFHKKLCGEAYNFLWKKFLLASR